MVEQSIEEIKKKFADGLDIDYTLKEISEGIFSLDEQYLGILVMLANNPATEYHLGKAGKEYGLDRDSVRRRLLGTKSLPSLEELEFVRPEEDLFRTGKKIKTYSLTIKGISASLSQTKFEDIFNIQIFKKNIHALTDNQFNIDDLIILYIKYHMALVMSWCEMNNSNITKTTSLEDVFHESFIPRILSETTSNPLVEEETKIIFINIVKRFVSIRHVVKQVISMMVDTKSAPIFAMISNFSSTIMKNLSKENLEDYLSHILIKDWHGYVNQADHLSQHHKFSIYEYEKVDYVYEGISFPWGREKQNIQNLTQDIFDILDIKSNKKINPYDMVESYEKKLQQGSTNKS